MPKPSTDLQPAIITIFGITGDLAKRYLLPSLYRLADNGLLSPDCKIVGVTRSGVTVEEILTRIKKSVESDGSTKCQESTMQWFKESLSIISMDITNNAEYKILKNKLDALENKSGICLLRVFYLAIPSAMFAPVVDKLGEQGLNKGCQHGTHESRLLIEKPFGYDLQSAKELIVRLQKSFTEDQIYRIDHYLAKETVQNILALRFNNPIFSETFNSKHISHIMITATESIGIENRVTFYEQMGAMRDFIQSHLLQLVALTTMDEPKNMDAKSIHQQKEIILNSILPPHADKMDLETVRGQYKTYRKEVSDVKSLTETYVAIKLSINNNRWRGVPVFIRTGKALAEKVNEITIIYNNPKKPKHKNILVIRIQPNEGIVLDLTIKKPGFKDELQHVQMDFCYQQKLSGVQYTAYERVLADTLRGDKTLFVTSQEVLASWSITSPILEAWANNRSALTFYDNGSWGPTAADKLVESAGASWQTDILNICPINFNLKK